ncbi:HAD-IC family P-type ATPase [Micrococcus terreus]|uniref:HAD-IC family P-type ATPase n=1 Tax=Micrococcus terreus TaxID=574650 RepID=UPI0028830A8F|nr:HAD-IC family P-type ATPase [Micrococcus terreus]
MTRRQDHATTAGSAGSSPGRLGVPDGVTEAGLEDLHPHEQKRRHHLGRRGMEGLTRPEDHVLAEHGLDAAAVALRQESGLTNHQPKDTSRSIWKILRVHVLTLFNLAIGACAVAIIVLGRWFDLVFCMAAVANVVIGVIQEYSAKRKLDRIALLHQDAAHVLRDSTEVDVPLEEILLDDAVVLRLGDQVPADGIVLTSDGLDIDESLLTGESDPVSKSVGDGVLSGSAVLSGYGIFRVTAVGADSHASQLAIEARKFTKIHSELRGALDTVAKWLTIALIPIVAIIVNGQVQAVGGWTYVLENNAMEPAIVAAVASITSMIPQGLALMTTISFAVAALKLAQEKVLIQEQPAVEILARVDTVCLDKTGTLTEGGIVFDTVTPAHPDATPESPGSTGSAASADSDGSAAHTGPLPWQQALGWLGADPNANPTTLALREAFTQRPAERCTAQVAFSSARRWSAVAFGAPQTPGLQSGEGLPDDGHSLSAAVSGPVSGSAPTDTLRGAWVLGAPEAVLEAARGHLDPGHLQRLELQCQDRASQGLRTMVLARSLSPAAIGNAVPEEAVAWFGAGEDLPSALVPEVVLTFRENVRDDAHETLEFFREQGVALKVISGDNPRTVAAVAREVGVELVGDGYDARRLPEDPEELAQVLEDHSVFGRVSPDQKQSMVKALQSRGHVVAMTGDGINDALALKTADLGIAMGNGAPATKAVSRMVLLDGKFSRLPSVLAEGRKVIANMERLAHMFLTKTSYAVLFGVVFSLLAWQFPLLPRQASTVDFLMIGLPTFFLALMPNPRRYVPGFLGRALTFAIPSGVVILLGMLAVNAYARWFVEDPATVSVQQIQTSSVMTLTLMGLWVLNLISRPLNRWKVLLIAAMYVLLFLVLTVPISQLFHQFELPPLDLGLAAVAIGAVACLLLEGIHRWHHARLSLAPEDPRPAA